MTRRTVLTCALAIATMITGVRYVSLTSPATAAAPDIASIAKSVAEGVGTVKDTCLTGTKGSVIVLEEFHTSRPGRVQSAIMLHRLHKRFGVTSIGLEGAYQAPKPLDGSWFHRAGGTAAAAAREDIAVQMLADGEINQAEFMMLVFPDIVVQGTERADEHPQLNIKGNPEVVYLLGIAEKSASLQARRHVQELLQLKKNDEAVEYLLNADPWVKAKYAALKDVTTVSLHDVIERIRSIEAKATALGADIDPTTKTELQELRRFYELRAKASGTMVERVARLAAPGTTVAMIIGAAHTPEVTDALKREDIAFAVLSPKDLNSATASLSNEQFDRKQAAQWAWNAQGTLGHILNGESNSPPITQTTTGRSYASMSLSGLLIAQAARANKPLPEALDGELGTFDGVRIDKSSFSRNGNDVIYRAWLQDVKGKEVAVWPRVGTTATPEELKDLEQKLLAAQQRIAAKGARRNPATSTAGGGRKGGGGMIAPTANGEHSERDHKNGREIVPLGPTALAVFGNSRQDVGTMPRISG